MRLIQHARAGFDREHGWTEQVLKLLDMLANAEVARRTGRTVAAVRVKRVKLGLPNPESPVWTAEELALFGTLSNAEIAHSTGRSLSAVSAKRWKLKGRGRE